MNDRAAFIRTICQSPADDAPRLVFADWLDECGTEPSDRDRAAFIRCQIETATQARAGMRSCLKTGLPLGADFRQPRHYSPRCRCQVCRPRMRAYYAARRWVVWDWPKPLLQFDAVTWWRGFPRRVLTDLDSFLTNCCGSLLWHHPLTDVRVRFHRPGLDEDYPRAFVWSDRRPAGRMERWHLPGDVWDRLRDFERSDPPNKYYPTFESAEAALSSAVVAYGRAVAGLPAL